MHAGIRKGEGRDTTGNGGTSETPTLITMNITFCNHLPDFTITTPIEALRPWQSAGGNFA